MSVINYFFEKHIDRCKKELEDFDNNKFKDVREDLKVGTRKQINEANNFFNSINAESYTDFEGFNKEIKNLNDELNRIMQFSANISSLVYVMPDMSIDDYYTYTDFISYFSYDENKFNNANERDIKQLKRFDKLIEKSDDDFELYKERGDLRAELGLYNEAIDDYKKAIELNPNYEEAKKCSERILEFDNNNPESYFVQGFVKQNLGQYEEAIKNYNKAIKLTPNDSHIYNVRGLAKGNLAQHEEAIKDFDKAIELNPNYIYAYYNRGNAKYGLGQYYEAIKDYDKVIELAPNYSLAYNNRGVSKENLGQYKKAIKDYNKAIELDPNNSYIYYNRGVSKENLEQYKDALNDYKKALELDPNNDTARKKIQDIQNQYGLR